MSGWEIALATARDYAPAARSAPDARLDMLSSKILPLTWMESFARPPREQYAEGMKATIGTAIRAAQLWFVSADLVDLIEAAAPSMPDQPMIPGDEPSLHGLVLFGKSIVDQDAKIDGQETYTNAMLWMPVDHHDTGRHSLTIVSLAFTGAAMGWIVIGSIPWYLGESQSDAETETARLDRARVATLWTLASQKRLTDGGVAVDRAAARRVRRAGMPPGAAETRVLDVRKPGGSNKGEGGSVDYSHRWMVSGHWRNQWLPSRGTHRAQWIAPYVKGPDDKPLVVRPDVKVVK